MRYAGNTSLSPQIQERIQNTFEQTVSLAQEGNRQEALLGCDFILRLDPLFEPARDLQERLSESEGPVEVDDISGTEETLAPEEPAAAEMATEVPVADVQVPEPSAGGGFTFESPPPTEPAAEVPVPVSVEPVPEPVDQEDSDTETGKFPPIDPETYALEDDAEVEIVPPAEDDTPIAEPLLADGAFDLADTPDTLVQPPPEEIPEVEADLPTEQAPPAPAEDVPARLGTLFEQRDYQQLMALAQENQELVAEDEELRQMVGMATDRLEAEPYVKNFLQSAQSASDRGDLESATSHLEKARELDPSHPEIAALEAAVEAAGVVEPPMAVDEIFAAEQDEVVAAEETASAPPEIPPLEVEAEAPESVPEAVPPLEAEPAARLDSESEQRIDDLLGEGQASFEDGEYQSAIDAWSRIFLIDIDHAEASRRIELARKLKAEVERQIEESFHEAINLLESGDEENARQALDKVLEMQPSHLGAKEYLTKLDSGELTASVVEEPELAALTEDAAAAPPTDTDAALEDLDLAAEPVVDLSAYPEELVEAPAAEPAPTPAPKKRSFVMIGSAVLILVLGIAWFVYSKWEDFFPASTAPQETMAAQPQIDPIERARELHESGSTAMAINVLRRLPPGHEQYAEAQALIAMWEAGDQPEVIVDTEPSAEVLAHREELMTQAKRAVDRGENLLALDLIQRAAGIVGLNDEELALREEATEILLDLENERTLFEQGDWEYALPNLWRMHEANPQNRDVVRLMVDSYYNLGLRDLQRGDPKAALEKFGEAQNLAPEDAELARLAAFADAYTGRPSDMLYRIFVKYQRFR